MNALSIFNSGHRSVRYYFLLPLSVLLLILICSCTRNQAPYSILEFSGGDAAGNYSKYGFTVFYESDTVNSTFLIAGKGDLIVYGEENFFSYDDLLQKQFSIKLKKNVSFINGKISSIVIPGDQEMIPWFQQMSSVDISGLGFIYFDSIISESYIPFLEELAKTKPHIGLGYGGTLEEMRPILEIFSPALLITGKLSGDDFNLLAGMGNLELLVSSLNDSAYSKPLPFLPKLKELIITEISNKAIDNIDMLANNKQIEKVTVIGSDYFDLKWIKSLINLKELVVKETDSVRNYGDIINHRKLEVLSLSGIKPFNNLALKELPGIRWMAFPEEVTQDQFNSFVEFHPGLEVAEFFNNSLISNLEPLSNLRKLYGLNVFDTLNDLNTIKTLGNLKYLSLPEEILKDSILKRDLQQALPGTKIVANHGLCLGSGWLLLIIPLMLILRLFTREKS